MRRGLALIALFIGMLLAVTGCGGGARPSYLHATVVWGVGFPHELPWRVTWTVSVTDGTVQRVEQQEGEVRTVDYQLADKDAFLQALHRALNADPIPLCADANTVVAQARDDTTQLYANELQQCGDQRRITDALIAELDRGSGAVSPGVES
ncbi:MAG: hypothetical protein QM286_07750 [Acidobacteriota bacterium]|nr:hypothetical protein [Acidobacteriota bacterium]